MLKKKDKYIFKGVIVEVLPNSNFNVYVKEIEKKILCYTSGKMRINYIRINSGDLVKIEVSKTSLNKGRIVYRLK
ncbi:translation initiation factor IF-1 [Candidatus Vidania fulgoroideorum]